MNWTLTCRHLLVSALLLLTTITSAVAQSITVSGNVSPSTNLCAGTSISLSFTAVGPYTAGNTFTLQRSDASGSFTSPVALGTPLTSAPVGTSALTITSAAIDANAVYGTGYRFRVVSSSPVRTSAQTASAVTIGTPLPGGAASFAACQNSGNLTLTATGSNLEWYNSAAATTASGTGPSYNVPTASAQTYYVTQTVNGCKSAKRAVVVNLSNPPATAPTINGLAAYCPGAGGTLTASGTGTSFRWINLTDGSVTNNASIAAPSQTTSYSVSQFSSAGCESPRVVFTATVYPVPGVPTVSNTAPSYCPANSPGTLTASVNGIGTSLRWTAPGGAQTNGASIPAPAASGAYSVQQISSNGCISPGQPVNVTVFSVPSAPSVSNANPAYCPENAPSTLTASGSGGALKWYLPGGGTSNGGSIAAPNTTGTYSYSVSEVSGNNCEGPRTAVSVTVYSAPTAAPTISNASPAYCSNARPASLTASGTGLQWFNTSGVFLGNNTIAVPASSQSYDVRQTTGQGCRGPALRVNVTIFGQPGNPGTANLALCQNETPRTLSATGSSLTWFTQGSTTPLPGPPTPSTSQANSFTVYEVTQTDGNNCVSNRSTLRFDVKALPAAPGVGSFSACQNAPSPTLSANGSALKWYDSNDVAIAGTPAPPTGGAGTQTYKVSQTVNGCEGPKASLTFTVYGLPAQPTVGTFNYCQAQSPGTLTASGSSIRWYNGSGVFLGNNAIEAPTTPATYLYQVSQTDARGCQSSLLNVNVQVRATPGAPGVSNPIFCQGRPAQQLTATGESLAWFDASGTSLSGAPTPPTTAIGQQRYAVNQTNGVGCTSTTAVITVTVNGVPANPTFANPRQYCAGETADVLTATGEGLRWYTDQTGGTGSISSIRPTTTPNPSGATSVRNYYVTQTVASCESERQAIPITTKRKPDLPTNLPNVSFCQTYSPPALTATPETGAALVWVYNNTDNATAPVPANNNATTFTYQVAQVLNGCRSDNASFQVRVKPTPLQPAFNTFSLCNNGPSRALEGRTTGIGTSLRYYDANDNLLNGTPQPSTAQVTTVLYKVSQLTDGCEGPRIDYPITIFPIPAQPGVANLQYCLNQPDQPRQNVSPLTAIGQNLQWFNSDGNAFPAGISPTPRTNELSDITYQVTQTVNNCASNRASINVKVVTTPTPTVSTSLVTYCRNDASQPLQATGTNLVWTDPNGVTSTAAPTPPTLNATSKVESYSVYSIGGNGCYSGRATIGLVVNTNPTLSLFGSTTVNYGRTADLTLRFTSQPPYSYTLTDGTGITALTGTASTSVVTLPVKPLSPEVLYRVASVSNVCGNGIPGNPATVTVFVNIPTVTTQALTSSNSICAGETFNIDYTTAGTFNQGNAFKVQIADTTSKSYIEVSTATASMPITATLSPGLQGGTYFVRVVATNPGAEVFGRPSPTLLTVKGRPKATLTGTQTIYETQPANLSVVLDGQAPWALTYQGSDGQTNTVNANASPYVITLKPTKTTTYQLVSVTNECTRPNTPAGVVSGTAVVTVDPLLAVEELLISALSIFPTPTQSTLTVNIDLPLSAQQPATLMLSDFSGRPVLTRTTEARQTQLDLSQQPAGLYLLNVEVGSKRVVRKVMKL